MTFSLLFGHIRHEGQLVFASRFDRHTTLSSAEAEAIAIVETAKNMVSLGMLLQTMVIEIEKNSLGMLFQTMALVMFNDAHAATSIGKMDGFLRCVRHLELRGTKTTLY